MRPPKRTCVEDCLPICIHRMPKGKNILRWMQSETEIASLEYERTQDEITIRAQVIAIKPQSRSVRDHRFALKTGACLPGIDTQQWIICECGRAASKLYIPLGKTDFRCRHCHNLTNRSAQTHSKRLALMLKHSMEIQQALTHWHPSRRALALQASLIHSSIVKATSVV